MSEQAVAPVVSRSERAWIDGNVDWRERHLDQLEGIYTIANTGLWGDVSLMIAVAEVLECTGLRR